MPDNKILVAISGASGAIYAKALLDALTKIKSQYTELSIVMSDNAKEIWQSELGNRDYEKYDARFWGKYDFSAPFASGSGHYNIMFIVPCSMGTLGRIASGVSNDLLTRAADVILKERRKLIAAPRETPYSLIHIRNMETVTLAGGIICPATPSFYSQPKDFEQLAATVTDRMIELAGLQIPHYAWGE